MEPISPEVARRARAISTSSRSAYTLNDWLKALNLEAGNDPQKLHQAALILREVKPCLTPHRNA